MKSEIWRMFYHQTLELLEEMSTSEEGLAQWALKYTSSLSKSKPKSLAHSKSKFSSNCIETLQLMDLHVYIITEDWFRLICNLQPREEKKVQAKIGDGQCVNVK